MKFDNVIIGGGLSGLTCAIRLSEMGQKCAVVSSGQSAIHFFSGSFDLLSYSGTDEVHDPLAAIKRLPAEHPYQRMGLDNVARIAGQVPDFLQRIGLQVQGECKQNHYVLTPMGKLKPTWLTLVDFSTFEANKSLPWQKVVILNFSGFLDFHTMFLKDGLQSLGVSAPIKNFAMKEFEAIRRNPSEMRSTNIAKVFDKGDAIDEFVEMVERLSEGFEVVMLPAVFGLFNQSIVQEIKAKIGKEIVLIPVVPPSTPGIRSQILLKKRFQSLGGVYFLGDNVNSGDIKDGVLQKISTTNHKDIGLEANNFILATGNFYSKGLVASPSRIYEPIFGLDIDADADKAQWSDDRFFNDQPFMRYGVKTDEHFRAMIDGEVVKNLYVAGSILAGANALKEGSGAGISMLTSLHVVEQIVKP